MSCETTLISGRLSSNCVSNDALKLLSLALRPWKLSRRYSSHSALMSVGVFSPELARLWSNMPLTMLLALPPWWEIFSKLPLRSESMSFASLNCSSACSLSFTCSLSGVEVSSSSASSINSPLTSEKLLTKLSGFWTVSYTHLTLPTLCSV